MRSAALSSVRRELEGDAQRGNCWLLPSARRWSSRSP
jgi:hypothetical protein